MHVGATATEDTTEAMRLRIAELEAQLASAKGAIGELATLTTEHQKLRQAYRRALEELQLMRRRLFVAKAERRDTDADQLAFDGMLGEVLQLERALDEAEKKKDDDTKPPKGKARSKPKGRRNLDVSTLPVVRVEITDAELEGKAERIGFEESSKLGYERGGARRIVVARAIYKVYESDAGPEDAATEAGATLSDARPVQIITAALPKELFRRGLLAPSMIAHILVAKYVMGVPFYRLEDQLAFDGASVDRGTMCRYAEDAGATLGAIVLAMRDDALATSFCLATDATGIAIQPTPLEDGKRQPCRKGHFFVVLADRDHVFFEYQPKHTSAAVCEMFRGYSGYIQADAHAVYDALYRGAARPEDDSATGPPTEVGCWSHARRKFWDAAVCKHRVGVQGLRAIDALFAADHPLAKLAPAQRHARRQVLLLPILDAFFAWANATLTDVHERGLVKTALGYVVRQEAALRRFLDDGRLRLENNAAERALRRVAVDVSLCTLSSSTRNLECEVVVRNSRRAPSAFGAAA